MNTNTGSHQCTLIDTKGIQIKYELELPAAME